jgi:hypothetical protein
MVEESSAVIFGTWPPQRSGPLEEASPDTVEVRTASKRALAAKRKAHRPHSIPAGTDSEMDRVKKCHVVRTLANSRRVTLQ